MTLSLRQLRYFVAIADNGAFARAAETLNIAQSALSHHMSEIEADLGVKLLDRRPRGVVLTPAGRRLYEHAGTILAAITKAEIDVKTLTEVASGPVSIGFSHTAAIASALPIMQAVRERCPEVHLTVREGYSDQLTDQVLSGALDFALIFNPSNDSRLERIPLLTEELYLIGRPEMIGAADADIDFGDIPEGSVLGLPPAPTRAMFRTQFLRNQIKLSPQLDILSSHVKRVAVEAGLGCAIMSRAMVGNDLAQAGLHARRIVDPVLARDLCLVMLAEHPQTRTFMELRQLLSEVVLEEVKSGRWPAEAAGTR